MFTTELEEHHYRTQQETGDSLSKMMQLEYMMKRIDTLRIFPNPPVGDVMHGRTSTGATLLYRLTKGTE